MFNFIKKKLFGAYTITTQKLQFYKYDYVRKELILKEPPTNYPAHLVIKDNLIFLYVDDEIKRLLEAKIFATNLKEMNHAISLALKNPSQVYEIIGSESSTGIKKHSVQKMGTADRMEIHISDKFFSIHSEYDSVIGKYKSVAQFFEK